MMTVKARQLALAATTASQFRSENLTGREQGTQKTPARAKKENTVRLTARGGVLLVRGRSSGAEMAIPLDATGEQLLGGQDFDLWVETALLVNYCRRAPGSVTLSSEDAGLVLSTGANTLELPRQATQDELPWEVLNEVATCRANALLNVILHVRHIRAEHSPNSAMLTAWRGVLLDGSNGALRAVAGNGFAVGICGMAYVGSPLRLLIPPGELNGLLAVLSAEGDRTVTLLSDERGSRLELRGERGHVRMNLMDHLAYPQYARIIPKGNSLNLRADAEDLRRALKQLLPLVASEKREVKLEVRNGRVELSCRNEYGTARAEFAAETEGEGVMHFNHTQLIQACSVKGELKISMSTNGSPALIIQGAYLVVVAVVKRAPAAA